MSSLAAALIFKLYCSLDVGLPTFGWLLLGIGVPVVALTIVGWLTSRRRER